MIQKARVLIDDDSDKTYPLKPGTSVTFVNLHEENFGSFTIEGTSPGIKKQSKSIVLEGVPDDGHVLVIDVNYLNSYQLYIGNGGDKYRAIAFISESGNTPPFNTGEFVIVKSEPFKITWDTKARSDIDVRVTISITPLAEEHGILISFTTIPLSEALQKDAEIARLASRNLIQIWLEEHKKK